MDALEGEDGFRFQLMIWGYATQGPLPRDRITMWLEDRGKTFGRHFILWDYSTAELDSILLDGERPPDWWAFTAAINDGLVYQYHDQIARYRERTA